MKTIGVTSIDPWFVLDNVPLIRELYYFDKLVYTIGSREILEKFCSTLPDGAAHYKMKALEIQRLEKAGLIYEYTDAEFSKDKIKNGTDQSITLALMALELASGFSAKGKHFEGVFVDFLERFREVGQLNARVHSIVLNKKDQHSYT